MGFGYWLLQEDSVSSFCYLLILFGKVPCSLGMQGYLANA